LNWKIKLKKIKIVQNSQEKKLEIKITSIKLKKKYHKLGLKNEIECDTRRFRKHLKLISYNLVLKNTSFFIYLFYTVTKFLLKFR
jgi:hypothetical protein